MPDHSWKCHSCKANNPAYTEVCRECGAAPVVDEIPPQKHELPVKEEPLLKLGNCPICNQPLPDDEVELKCPHCQSDLKVINGRWKVVNYRGRFYATKLLCGIVVVAYVIGYKSKLIHSLFVSAGIMLFIALGLSFVIYEAFSDGVISYKGVVFVKRTNPVSFSIVLAVNFAFIMFCLWASGKLFFQ